MNIILFGFDVDKCKIIEENTIKAVKELGISASIEKFKISQHYSETEF